MAVDNRPFKSKEQDGQGNEVIIRDQQLVEQGTTTTMPAGACFQTLDVDGRPVKIPKDNMLNLIVEGLGIIFNGQIDQQTVTKVPTLNGNNFGASTVATLASVLGADAINSYLDSNNSPTGLSFGYCGGEDGSAYYGFWMSLQKDNSAGVQLKIANTGNKVLARHKNVNTGEWEAWFELNS